MIKPYRQSQVRVTDAYFSNSCIKDVAYLKSIDTDRLLAGFYETAGLPMKKERYGGWESMLIGGHTLGHYLTAAAQGYVNPGVDKEDKDVLYKKITDLIDGLLECQAASKGKPGFVFGAKIMDPSNVELQFDHVEFGRTNIITESWVPWYTLHKLLDGIMCVYELTGYENALKLGSGIGDWAYARCSKWSEETRAHVLGIEYGGINDALYELYKNTGKKEHLDAAHVFDEETLFKKVYSGEKNVLNNHHANTTIPKFLGALNRYMILGDEASEYLEYVKAFWDMVVERHTYITGGNSEWEHFGEDNVLDTERTNCNNETCNTHNMLKMSRKLFMITGDKKYADYYENTLINAILSSQNPDDGMTMYFQPMATGYYKVYGTPFDKFWCCTGTGMENFTKLNDSIYFKQDNNIYVNMFVSSVLEDTELGLELIQQSSLPDAGSCTLSVKLSDKEAAVEAAVCIRIPDWAAGYKLKVEPVKGSWSGEPVSENGYMEIRRIWKDGDKVELGFDMKVKACGLPDCDSVFAFRYGPVVLSADLGCEDMQDGSTGVIVTIPTNKLVKNEYIKVNEGTVEEFIRDINSHFEKDPDELKFVLKDTDQELVFGPHYRKKRERYGIYWYFIDSSADEAGREEERKRRELEEKRRVNILDVVQPGYGQYEVDELHAMEDNGSTGITNNGTSRSANPGGGFVYHMKAAAGADMLLELHFLREDNGKTIRVFAGEEVIYDKRLHYIGSEEEYVVLLPVSKELADKCMEHRTLSDGTQVDTLPIGFKSGAWMPSARVFGFIYLLKDYTKQQ